MRPGLVQVLCLAATAAASPAKAEPFDWRNMARTLVSVAEGLATPSGSIGPDVAYGHDLRRICQDDTATFAVMMAAEDCPEGDCDARRAVLAHEAKALAAELERRIQEPDAGPGSNAALFVPPGLTLTSIPENAV